MAMTFAQELAALSKEANGEPVQLERLNETLKRVYAKEGSMKRFKDFMKDRGICLRDCKEYGDKLRAALRKNKHLRVRLCDAKQFGLVAKCLIGI